MHDFVDALDAVVYVHEAARLMAIAPDFNGAAAHIYRFNYFATNGGWRFLAAAIPGAMRPVHVVESGCECRQASLRPIFLTEHLRDQLLPAVATLRHGWISIRFL